MPQTPTREERHLAEADRRIAEAEGRIARQAEIAAELGAGGHDTTQAEHLLQNMTDFLDAACVHRRLIVEEIARQEKELR